MQLFERIVRTAVYALLAGFAGLVVWSFLAAFVKIATRVDIQSFPALAAAGLVGAGLVVARSVWTVRKNHVATVLAREEVELKEFNDHRQAENYLRGRALWFARSAVEDLDRMPDLLSSAAASYSRARETFADGAFSPFWSAIESSFRDLGQYLAAADRIGANARSYAGVVADLARMGDVSALEFSTFPVELDVRRVAAHHRELTEKLDAVVYEAQKIPTFATIWEQRRTTTAVIEGFRNLEDAVDRMAKGLDSSLDGLGASLAASSDDVTRALRGLHEDSIAAAQGQLSATRELSSRAGEIRDHLYYPELSRWLH